MSSNQNNKSKRIELVDALRGFALMGLFLVHMVEYFELYWYKPEASIFNDITFFLFGGKAYAVFALLFGLSFFLIMDSQAKKGIDFRFRFGWRLGLLLIAGIFHGLIYGGDILQILAITGFFLIPIYNSKNYILVGLAFVFLLQLPAILHYLVFIDPSNPGQPLHWSLFGPVVSAYAEGSFSEVLAITLWKAQYAKWAFMLESGRLSTIMGMSILGFYLGKIDFFRNVINHKKSLIVSLVLTLSIAIIAHIERELLTSLINVENNWFSSAIINSYNNLLFTISGVIIFVLIYQINPIQKILLYLTPCGRMSLTIYVFQSIVFVPFFYGYGIGAYGFLGQTLSFYLGIVFWIAQVMISNYWIKKYYYGPLEWTWRSATYLTREIKFKRT